MNTIRQKHIRRLFYKNAAVATLLLILITGSLTLIGSTTKKQQESHQISKDFKLQYGKYSYYWTNEALDDKSLDTYWDGDRSGILYHKMQQLVEDLKSAQNFDFYSCDTQSLILYQKTKKIFLDGYETGDIQSSQWIKHGHPYSEVKALMVSSKFFNCNHIRITKGKGFMSSDYRYKAGATIPILLGNAYRTQYQIGDTFKGHYLFKNFTFKVIGFLQKRSFYLASDNEFKSVERYIILPAWKIRQKSFFARVVTQNELNGNIRTRLTVDSLQNTVDSIVSRYNRYWSVGVHDQQHSGGEFVTDKYIRMTGQVTKQYNLLVFLVTIFTSVSFFLCIIGILRRNRYHFSIEYLCGGSRHDIWLECMGFTGILLLTGDLLSSGILFLSGYRIQNLLSVQLLTVVLFILFTAGCYFYIQKMNLTEIIGGNE